MPAVGYTCSPHTVQVHDRRNRADRYRVNLVGRPQRWHSAVSPSRANRARHRNSRHASSSGNSRANRSACGQDSSTPFPPAADTPSCRATIRSVHHRPRGFSTTRTSQSRTQRHHARAWTMACGPVRQRPILFGQLRPDHRKRLIRCRSFTARSHAAVCALPAETIGANG